MNGWLGRFYLGESSQSETEIRMVPSVKDMAKRAGNRVKSTTGYRLLRTKRWGVDWLDDCMRLAAQQWHPDFGSLDVVFDVGANTGQTARKILQRTSPSRVCCFEPVADTFTQLLSGTSHLRGVECFPFGLSDENTEAKINIYSSSVLASTCESSPILSPDCELFQRCETIALRTLDSVCRDLGIHSIDLLKVDTEGADLRTLHGAGAMLAGHRIGMVLFEFYCPTSTMTQNGTFLPVDAYLSSHGYRLISFYTDYVAKDQPTGVYNALYAAVPREPAGARA